MKFRSGFVSNSSSSSFTCDVCGEEVSGMDMGLSEAEMSQCVNNHTFCDSEKVEVKKAELSLSDKKSILMKYYKKYDNDIYVELLDADEDTVNNYWDDYQSEQEDDDRYEMSAESCPICQFVNTTNADIAAYYMKKAGVKREDMAGIFKGEFGTYEKFKESTQ